MKTLDFYFDFSSPYGYLASEQIDALATRHGYTVAWHPILLGAIFKVTGAVPLIEPPLKGDYYLRDFARSARFHGVPFRQPQPFPIATVAAARAFLWLRERDLRQAHAFAHLCFRAYFVDGLNISEPEQVLALAHRIGVDRGALAGALGSAEIKERLRAEVDGAIARGVCGSPFFIVGDEPFWGVDRLPQLEKWLEAGGF